MCASMVINQVKERKDAAKRIGTQEDGFVRKE